MRKKSFRTEVVVDARMLKHSGIGTYLKGLLGEFQGHSFFERHPLGIALSRHCETTLRHPEGRRPEGSRDPSAASRPQDDVILFHSPIYSLQEQIEYPFHLNRCRLWHAPHYNVPLLKFKTRLVVTLHDLIHWIFRREFYSPLQAFYAENLIRSAVSNSDRIIAVSEKTRDDLMNYFKAPVEKIRVIYEGVQPEFFHPPGPDEKRSVLAKYGLPERFFVYVGLIKPHKNIKRLLTVFRKLKGEGKLNSSLVLIGKKDRAYPRGYEALEELATGDGIYYLPNVDSREELHSIYASALALVHPSLYEGFGLTVLEAMASGTPVIVSKAGSLPEVVGQSGFYIDPQSEESLAEALEIFENNVNLHKEFAAKGRDRARRFSWQHTAAETLQVYEEVLSL